MEVKIRTSNGSVYVLGVDDEQEAGILCKDIAKDYMELQSHNEVMWIPVYDILKIWYNLSEVPGIATDSHGNLIGSTKISGTNRYMVIRIETGE